MADEAVLFYETEVPIPFTVADGTAITKGAVLQLNTPMTAIAATANNAMVAGIAAADKIASDGVTKLAVYREGIFNVTCSGTVTAGDPGALVLGLNRITSAVGQLQLSGSRIAGIFLESGTNGQIVKFNLKPQCAFVAV